MSNADDVENYIHHFHTRVDAIRASDTGVTEKKILLVTMLSALAVGRYPNTERDSQRFQDLIRDHSDWPDGYLLFMPELAGRITPCLRNRLHSELLSRIEGNKALRTDVQASRISRAFPSPCEVLPDGASEHDKQFLERGSLLRLLYDYRNTLVHEFREPGHGFEFDTREREPYCHTVSDLNDGPEKLELVYPIGFFDRLVDSVLRSLKYWYTEVGVNPYEHYDFGSPWKTPRPNKRKTTRT